MSVDGGVSVSTELSDDGSMPVGAGLALDGSVPVDVRAPVGDRKVPGTELSAATGIAA
jgi:hypothetical protein